MSGGAFADRILNFLMESSAMTLYRFNPNWRVSILSLITATLMACPLPAAAQTVRVAQRDDAGESATDDPADTGELTVYPDAQEEEVEVLSPEEQAAALERRAGEQGDGDPENKAVVLGMHVQESDEGRAKVIDIAAASPAFEAGVREGDEIISFDGFTAKTYREWIDGIRKLVTDTPDGKMVSVELLRGDKRITAQIRTPEAKADDPRMPGVFGQRITEQQQAQGGALPTGVNQPFPPGVISDNDVFVNGSGFFDDDLSGTTDRAMAQIFRLTPQPTSPVNPPNQPGEQAAAAGGAAAGQQALRNPADARQNPAPPTNPASGAANRIGLAGFQDDTNGMVVMLDVGGLPAGSYAVGIEDAGLILGGQRPMRSAQNNPVQSQQDEQSQQRTNRIRRPFDRIQTNPQQLNSPPTNAPRPQPRQPTPAAPSNRDQSQTESSSLIPATILAQVADENSGSGAATPPTGQVQPNSTPPTGEVNPNLTPPTGQVNPSATPPTGRVLSPGAPPTGQVLPPGAPPTGRVLPSGTSPTGQPDPDAENQDGVFGTGAGGDIASGNALSGATLAQIGMLTVDQSGTGRLQQVVEGVRVRDVVGQAIVLYAPATPPVTTVPPNANVSGTRGESAASATANQPQPPSNLPGPNRPRQAPAGARQQANTGPLSGSPTPVAAGIIQLMADRRPSAAASGTAGAIDQQNQPTQRAPGEQPAGAQTTPAQPPNQ
jgi:hypothetical protein